MSEHFGGVIVFLQRFLLGSAAGNDESHLERVTPGFADRLVISARLLSNAVEFGNVALKAQPPNAEGSYDAEQQYDEKQPRQLVAAPRREFGHQSREPQRRLAALLWNRDQQGQNHQRECRGK